MALTLPVPFTSVPVHFPVPSRREEQICYNTRTASPMTTTPFFFYSFLSKYYHLVSSVETSFVYENLFFCLCFLKNPVWMGKGDSHIDLRIDTPCNVSVTDDGEVNDLWFYFVVSPLAYNGETRSITTSQIIYVLHRRAIPSPPYPTKLRNRHLRLFLCEMLLSTNNSF